jgi:hypothetical protein
MYAIATNVPIDLATHFIDVIQKVLSNKESSLIFRCLITRVVILAKVPFRDVEPIVKMFGKIYVVIVVKSKVVVSKKRPFDNKSTSSKPESPSTNLLLQRFLTNKFDSFTLRWDQKAGEVNKLLFDIQQDVVQVNDWLVQLRLDVKQIHHTVMGDDNSNLFLCL